ncbi:Hypothetical protein ORPV_745 [Orpheovirus IHUMI-LCC2]|uniref:Uncharacterized protein n=1 Tax=Orpheovirus IHUMI-LCC2 TaxID=2023057 RepID=A0A2I2L5B5_9VIRU|nr:Hypothetical protein ORPV_745 [Orpheovirus IHUMI-LCC2]SNW62649.1 Hypothetical protein ORPV_745 [Orpheovirus IHUMI-LCC2]
MNIIKDIIYEIFKDANRITKINYKRTCKLAYEQISNLNNDNLLSISKALQLSKWNIIDSLYEEHRSTCDKFVSNHNKMLQLYYMKYERPLPSEEMEYAINYHITNPINIVIKAYKDGMKDYLYKYIKSKDIDKHHLTYDIDGISVQLLDEGKCDFILEILPKLNNIPDSVISNPSINLRNFIYKCIRNRREDILLILYKNYLFSVEGSIHIILKNKDWDSLDYVFNNYIGEFKRYRYNIITQKLIENVDIYNIKKYMEVLQKIYGKILEENDFPIIELFKNDNIEVIKYVIGLINDKDLNLVLRIHEKYIKRRDTLDHDEFEIINRINDMNKNVRYKSTRYLYISCLECIEYYIRLYFKLEIIDDVDMLIECVRYNNLELIKNLDFDYINDRLIHDESVDNLILCGVNSENNEIAYYVWSKLNEECKKISSDIWYSDINKGLKMLDMEYILEKYNIKDPIERQIYKYSLIISDCDTYIDEKLEYCNLCISLLQ